MISEGSCDTEDWSNDAENTALHHRNYCIFDQINAALESIKAFFQKITNYPELSCFSRNVHKFRAYHCVYKNIQKAK